ncbi:MAG: hypothetical protein CMP49_04615 [Flavobacteriales bacterium]|nr:hypothetical protein [Flavobacteriales bacterium]
MANATSTQLQELYVAYFGRAADPTGLDYWTEKGISTAKFAADMYAQAEFKDAYGSLSTESQVNQIYKNLFDREADVTGLTYWTQQINLGNLQLAEIANHLIWAAQNNEGSSDDKTALANRTDAAVAYTAEIKTTVAGILAYQAESTDPWKSGVNLEEAKTYLSGIDKDTAYTAAGITASVSTVTSNGVPTTADTAVNAVLTTGMDTGSDFSGGSGTDQFSALNTTLTTGDNFSGGSGTDTLSLTSNLSANTTLAGYTTSGIENFNVTLVDGDTAAAETLTLNTSNSPHDKIQVGGTSTTTLSDTVTFTNVAADTILDLVNSTDIDVTVTYLAAARAGTSDAATLNLKTVGSTAGDDGTITYTDGGTAITSINTLTVTTSGAAAVLGDLAFGGTTLNISGDQDLTIRGDLDLELDTISASTFTGDLDIDTANDTSTPNALVASVDVADITITSGSGEDVIDASQNAANNEINISTGASDDTVTIGATPENSGTATVGDVIAGGAGTDTLTSDVDLVDTAAVTTALTGVSGFETLNLSGAMGGGDTVTLADLSSDFNRVNVSSVTAGTGITLNYGTGASTLGLNIAAAVTAGDTATIDTGTGTSDSLAIVNMLTTGDTGSTTSNYTITDFEDVSFDTGSYDTPATQNVQAFNIGANTLTITGSNGLTTAGAITATTIDGSALTGALVMNSSASVTTITGGSAADTLVGDAASTIDGGAGADIITGGTGNDTLTGGTGADVITTNTGNDTVTAGAGNDTVNVDSGLSALDVITGGDGTDILATDAAATAATSAGVSGFETLMADTALTQDLAVFTQNQTFSRLDINVAGAVVFNNASSTVTNLDMTTTGGTATVDRLVDGTTNELTISADDATAGASDGITTYVAVTAEDEETINLVSGSDTAEVLTITTLTSTDLLTLNLSGTANVVITNAIASSTALATVDASGMSGTAATTVNASNSTVGVTMTGGGGIDTFTSGVGGDTITGGAGADIIDSGAGNDTISGGAGADTIDAGVGGDTITGGAGVDPFTQTYGDSVVATAGFDASTGQAHLATATWGVGDTITFGNGVDVYTDFTAGTGGDTIDVTTAGAPTTFVGDAWDTIAAADDLLFLSGEYDASSKVFTTTADGTGSDTLILDADTSIDTDLYGATDGTKGLFILQGVDSDDLVAANFV